ncbi:MAG: hypothetical protein HY518_01090 [Candidatus Aenigmarchaeota archaeon]|nr:hypothetical protein [Candidatus Aenigmarchaeota archaeon]
MKRNLVNTVGKTQIYLEEGDITQIPADAMMAAINSFGEWQGGIDRAIYRVAGERYHSQARKAMPLHDLQTVIAKGDRSRHRDQFNDVVFVVDDLRNPLDMVVYSGLEAAHQEQYGSLLIPAIRMGVMTGAVEKTPIETVAKLGEGILEFLRTYTETNLKDVTFVVYRDPASLTYLGTRLRQIR